MQKWFFLQLSLIAIFAVAHAQAAQKIQPAPVESKQERYENLELFQKVLHFVESNYVDEVKNKDLIHGAIKGMLETLDPHSNFLPPDIFKDMKIDTSGKYGGLGLEVGVHEGILTVISPIEDSPAWKAGIKPGDKIVKINGKSSKGINVSESISLMRGKRGSEVLLGIQRDGWLKVKDIIVVRDTIKIQAVKYELLDDGFGYLRLSSFNENSAEDLKHALEKLEKKNPKLRGLVFDLRMNPGGLLDQAIDVSSLFIDSGVVVSTIGRDQTKKEIKYVKKGSCRKDIPLAVLVNSGTASAAEIVAGALQDHKRAIILGSPTFGKGSVQTVIDLGSDLGLKLTIARYYTPSGKSIQEKGVIPDIELDDFDTMLLASAKRKQEIVREKDLKGHIVNLDSGDIEAQSEPIAKSTNPSPDDKSQLKKNPDNMEPEYFLPKQDYQVKEAIKHLRSYEIFRTINLSTVHSEDKSK